MQFLLPIHILTAGLGIVSGLVALSAAKGATLHRKSGILFVCAMTVMCITATVLAAAKGQAVNVIAGLTTAYLVLTALTTVRTRSAAVRRLDGVLMVAALVLGLTTLTIGFEALVSESGKKYGYPPFAFFMFGAVAMLGSVGDLRMLWSPLPVLLVLLTMLYWLWRVRTRRTTRIMRLLDGAASSSMGV